jgi:hypothetical protein
MTGTVLLFPKTPTMNLIYKHYITPPSKEGFFHLKISVFILKFFGKLQYL